MSKHDTGFIKILVLIFCLGLIQLTNSGCTKWSSKVIDFQISNQPLSAVLNGTKVFESDVLAKKVFYLAINSSIIKAGSGFAARQESFCTGIALTQKLVLTAAHCIVNIAPEKINLVEGVSPWLSPLNPDHWHQVEYTLTHPKYKKGLPEYDLALLHLRKPLRSEAITEIYENDPNDLMVTLAGFGFRVSNVHSSQAGSNEGNEFLKNNSGELFFISKFLKNYTSDQLTFIFEKSIKESVCIGDSGGPALIYDETKQTFFAVGLLSGTIETTNIQTFNSFEDYDFCSGTPVYNNLRHPEIKSWIDRSVNQLTNQLIDANSF